MIKKIGIGLAVVAVVVIGAVYFLYSNLGGLVKTAIEKYGSEATQAKVSVGSVDITPSSGAGAISKLMVGNPSGFSTPSAFSLGQISLKIDTSTITQNPIVIKEVVIAAPKITYEHASGGSNLDKLKENVTRYAGAAGGKQGGASGGDKKAADGKEEKKIIIENLYVRDGQIGISHSLLKGKTLDASLPTIHLTDIGKGSGGASPAEVANRVIGAISEQASKVAVSDIEKQVKGAVGDAVKSMTDGAKDAGGGIGGAVKGLLGK